jgi:hypothetical protein
MAADEMTPPAGLEAWFTEHAPGLRREGVEAEITRSPAGRDKASAWVDLAGAERLGQLVVWDDGAVALSVADIASGETLTQEHRMLSSAGAVADAADSLVHWVRSGQER